MIKIEVACVTPEKQLILCMQVAPGTTALEAITQSGLVSEFPELLQKDVALGNFGQSIQPSYAVQQGDRIEVYCPLVIDPKEARFLRVKKKAI